MSDDETPQQRIDRESTRLANEAGERIAIGTTETTKTRQYSYRYNYTEQRWERKTKSSDEWEHDKDREFPTMNDETFLKEYTDERTFPSIASLARWFGVSYKSIYHKRLAMNTKIREAYGKPKDFVALKEKPKFTDDEKRRKEEIDNKPATIQDIVSSLPESIRKSMGLP